MKLGGRYKVIGKKRHAVLDLPYGEVLDTFEEVLCDSGEVSRLTGSVNRETGVFKIEYKISAGKRDVYENYCMLVQLRETDNGGTRIDYAFVYDRLLSWYTRILSLICFAVPLAATLMIYFMFELRSPIHLALYIPLLLISAFGLFSLFGCREKCDSVKPMVKEFEQLLINAFDGQ